ncbi:MerR family transcriptional regulator [Burkholderia multivorans]|uniref:Transcriptional regulator, MerR family n=2 Tax=Burkholderia multivorans TaxID=87883 RepID=B9BM47_9BURK|nr:MULTISPECIES: MerR family transcriptional regulator [Burkholderia]EEE07707.1 transcriptional regulator, MerR family [Burkholderia multivorans CGD2]EEE14355.1 transcriptional regulator, MerR family [Burkholderia multivorans CGD2M]MBJ9682256.1 MerR family transcriptional regulator [Burkholderia multivorans]MBU9669073.1 MerR family transcriptional regulator [Burkholderia multivorans]MCA8263516.1 MerR family transcriptional regulator [Burkholderia multivorans]
MRLKVGELAKRSGLTVRTLHHYHAIGLLTPSARADNGYRLYDRRDIARLHQIQALRRFGLSLAEIGDYLNQPDTPLVELVAKQIASLDRQLAQAAQLRERLVQLHAQLAAGTEPELADWLTTLELMTVYDKYFSEEELARLPMYRKSQTGDAEWIALVADVRALHDAGVPAEDERVRALADRWMALLVRDTNNDPRLLAKLNLMHEREPSMQAQIGITTALRDYVLRANAETKMRIFEKYLDPDEIRFMRAHYGERAMEWPLLMADVRDALEAGKRPDSPEGRALAQRWMALFRGYAGDDPATHAKFRQAMANEPALKKDAWVDDALLGFMREAMAQLAPAR